MKILDLGLIGYEEALDAQKETLIRRIEGRIPDTLILCEHDPVITLGRTSGEESLLDEAYFKEEGIEVIPTSRGGKITYHAPGQLLVYPVIDLSDKKKDISIFIDVIERSVLEGLKRLGVDAERITRRGVWVGKRKIAFIGISLKKWVTYHGVCININNDITPFRHFNPCGESDIRVTSVRNVLGKKVDMSEAKRVFASGFSDIINKEYSEESVPL